MRGPRAGAGRCCSRAVQPHRDGGHSRVARVARALSSLARLRRSGSTPPRCRFSRRRGWRTLHPYDPEHPSDQGHGEAAVAALGADPAQVFKTLVARVDGVLTVAVVPVSGTLDLKALAAAAGGRKAVMADLADAEHDGLRAGRDRPGAEEGATDRRGRLCAGLRHRAGRKRQENAGSRSSWRPPTCPADPRPHRPDRTLRSADRPAMVDG